MIEPVSAPPYGERTLAEVVPSVLDAAGVEGFTNALGIAPTDRACLVVVDGLGWELVRDHRAGAPFLSELFEGSRPISAVFPSTTAASLASLGTGLPPGEHGLVGYTFAVPGHARPMNALRWELYGIGEHVDLVDEFPPERIQRHPTLMQRAEAAGLPVTVVGPAEHDGTLRMTISGHDKLPDPIIGGKAYPLRSGSGGRSAGMIFFNDEGNEDGGLVYSGRATADGYRAGAGLSFD